jgi:hypothetical protein
MVLAVDQERPPALSRPSSRVTSAATSGQVSRPIHNCQASQGRAELAALIFRELSRTMKKAGLDDRHRDKDGEIQQKRSDTLNKNLSKPIAQFSPETTLGEMRTKTGKISEAAVRRAAAKLAK